MPNITYIEHNGTQHTVEVATGSNLMQGALDNLIEGIVAECGGCCVCSTCHCMIDQEWVSVTGKPNSDEADLLEVVDSREATSRLSCQVTVTDEMEGLIVRLPESQY